MPKRPNPERTPFNPSAWTDKYWNGARWVDTSGFHNLQDLSIYKYNRSYSSTSTPGFRQIKRKQRLPIRSHSVSIQTSDKGDYYEETINRYGNFERLTQSSGASRDWARPNQYTDRSVHKSAERLAVQKLGNDVNGMKINLAQAFAERKQTASLLANSASRIASAALALRRADLKGLYLSLGLNGSPSKGALRRVTQTPSSKRVANHWLEYTFGWVPLLDDVTGAAELLASHAMNDLYHEEAKGIGRASATRRVDGSFVKRLLTETCVVKYGIRYRLDSASRAVLSQTGISNPLLLAWELLPYSFVVDWFLPVGQYLKALNTFDGFVLTDGYRSELWNGRVDLDFSRRSVGVSSYSGGGLVTVANGSASYSDTTFFRTRISDFPSVALPQFRNPLGNGPLWKFATSLALMRQVFGR